MQSALIVHTIRGQMNELKNREVMSVCFPLSAKTTTVIQHLRAVHRQVHLRGKFYGQRASRLHTARNRFAFP